LNPRSRSAQKNIAHVYSERLDRPQDAIAAPLPAIDYTIFGAVVSDSFGVDPDDPTGDPVHQCPDDPLMFCYPGGAPSPDPYLWDDFLDTLPEVPDLSGSELADLLLGDWWSWFWDQEPGNGPPLTLDDDYQTDQDTPLTVDPAAGVLGNDVEPEADPVSAILLDDVRFGTLALQLDGSFVYRPAPLFFGVDAPSPIQANRTSASTSLETTEPVVDQQFSNGQRPADLVRGPTALAPSHSKRAEGVFERSNDMAVRRAAYLLTNHRPVEFDDVLADVLASAGRTPRR